MRPIVSNARRAACPRRWLNSREATSLSGFRLRLQALPGASCASDFEKSTLLELLHKQTRRFEAASADAWTVAAGDSKVHPQLPPGVRPQDLAGWTVVARVLLNLDETITKE